MLHYLVNQRVDSLFRFKGSSQCWEAVTFCFTTGTLMLIEKVKNVTIVNIESYVVYNGFYCTLLCTVEV